MKTAMYLTLYVATLLAAAYLIYAVGLYYVNKTLPASCSMHSTLMMEECMFEESKTNIILKAYKG